MLVQLRYRDHRLAYNLLSPKRTFLLGEEALRDKIWVPHIIIKNERNSALMGLDGKDVFVSISPEGDVLYSYRMTSTFYCWMNLQKFPFDVQICELIWVSCKCKTIIFFSCCWNKGIFKFYANLQILLYCALNVRA